MSASLGKRELTLYIRGAANLQLDRWEVRRRFEVAAVVAAEAERRTSGCVDAPIVVVLRSC